MSFENNYYPYTSKSISSYKFQTTNNPLAPSEGVNVVLGGAMISGIIIMIVVICYCCHRNQLKRETHINSFWNNREPTMLTSEIFTIDGAQLIEVAEYQVGDSIPSSPRPSPPPYESIVDRAPSYESVVDIESDVDNENIKNQRKIRRWSCSHQAVVVPIDDPELPSYESALKLLKGAHI